MLKVLNKIEYLDFDKKEKEAGQKVSADDFQ